MSRPLIGVVTFPGTNCDRDCLYVLREVVGADAEPVWHEEENLDGLDAVVLPGGFSYGDYLRAGAIARFAPAMQALARRVADGMPVLGICNGFQILLEAGLLPGAMRPNRGLRFLCRPVKVKVENTATPFTHLYRPGEVLTIPIAHYAGNYFAWPHQLQELQRRGQVVFRYCGPGGEDARTHPQFNPNGSAGAVAGLASPDGRVLGMMPHPERASETAMGSQDGLRVWLSLVEWIRNLPRRPLAQGRGHAVPQGAAVP